MDFLEKPSDRGYPVEYLLSRIKGRRARLIRDWKSLIYGGPLLESLASPQYRRQASIRSPEDVWGNLFKEYRWVYGQMNNEHRQIFQPFFLYSELRTICICLRHMKENKGGPVNNLIEVSMLSEDIKQILTTSSDTTAAVAGLERIFSSLSKEFTGLGELFDAEGLRGIEQRLTNTYLTYSMAAKMHPLMKAFFSRIIDARNIMSLYKCLRLEIATPPVFLPSGSISVAKLQAVLRSGDLFGITSLIREFIGIRIDNPEPTLVEVSLYKGITRYLRKEGKEPFGVGPLLDYLWRCSIEAMNLSMLFQGKDLEREAVIAELVQ